MSEHSKDQHDPARANDFLRAANKASPSFLRELLDFVLTNKKWWLVPIIIVLLLLSALILAGTSGIAPFIYPLF